MCVFFFCGKNGETTQKTTTPKRFNGLSRRKQTRAKHEAAAGSSKVSSQRSGRGGKSGRKKNGTKTEGGFDRAFWVEKVEKKKLGVFFGDTIQ